MRQRWLAFGGNARQEYAEKLQELQNKNWNGIPGTMFTEEQDGIVTESSPRRCRGMKIAARPRGERIEKRAR